MADPASAVALALAAVAVVAAPPGALVARRSRAPTSTRPVLRRAAFPAVGAVAVLVLLGAPWWSGLVAGGLAAWAGARAARRVRRPSVAELRSLAVLLDVFAACLEAGLPPSAALAAVVAGSEPSRASSFGHGALGQTAALLQLGCRPAEAWRPVGQVVDLAPLAAAASRSAVGGLTLADAARETSDALRASARAAVSARAGRAGVAMTAPLTLCFLPAFFCLGLAPAVIGMVSGISLW